MVEIIGLGERSDPDRLDLVTKARWPIPNSQPKPLPPFKIDAAVKALCQAHPDAVLRSKSSEYNCVGLVFASRRTVVGIEHLERILKDDGYRRISEERLFRGDLVVYRDARGAPQHVGIVAARTANVAKQRFDVEVLSQWGLLGEYFHRIDDVPPIHGTPQDFWTERI